jgi:hypothetical protein
VYESRGTYCGSNWSIGVTGPAGIHCRINLHDGLLANGPAKIVSSAVLSGMPHNSTMATRWHAPLCATHTRHQCTSKRTTEGTARQDRCVHTLEQARLGNALEQRACQCPRIDTTIIQPAHQNLRCPAMAAAARSSATSTRTAQECVDTYRYARVPIYATLIAVSRGSDITLALHRNNGR